VSSHEKAAQEQRLDIDKALLDPASVAGEPCGQNFDRRRKECRMESTTICGKYDSRIARLSGFQRRNFGEISAKATNSDAVPRVLLQNLEEIWFKFKGFYALLISTPLRSAPWSTR
jgi:hypothetical protein